MCNTFALFFPCNTFVSPIPLCLAISPIHNTLYRMSNELQSEEAFAAICMHPFDKPVGTRNNSRWECYQQQQQGDNS